MFSSIMGYYIVRAAEGAGGPPPGMQPQEPEVGPDGEIIGGPRTMQQIAAQRRLQQQQAQVEEVSITIFLNYKFLLIGSASPHYKTVK